ncbi:MAG: glycerophosphodiester phosphodiesterase [Planctomycetes bacterium]|nr:glycerophosphodiester phosphodiesterase [Planctomycetota bacterium]
MKLLHFSFLSTAIVMSSHANSAQAVEIIGHRGASFDAPENTLASVNLAWKQNADAVEIDIYLTRDGHIVAVHDETTKRYGGPDKNIVEQTLAELKTIDVGRWKDKKWAGERIPTLTEVLKTIPDGKRLFIEIKSGPEILPELQRVIHTARKKPEQTAIISFSLDVVTAAKKEMPQLKAYWIVGLKQHKVTRKWSPQADELIHKAGVARLDGLDIGKTAGINKAFADEVKQAGLDLYVWTINSPSEAARLISLGIDGITTDRPGWLRSKLATE